MLKRVCLALGIVACLGSLALAVDPNTPGSITGGSIVVPANVAGVYNLPIQVNAPLLATAPGMEIIAWLDAGPGALFVNGPLLLDTAPLGSFNASDFDTPGVDLLTGAVLGPAVGGNHASSPNRTLVPPAPPSTAGVPAIVVGVLTANGNPAPVGTWNGLLATLRISVPALPAGTQIIVRLEDHPELGSTNLGGFFDENFEFIINQPDVINGLITVQIPEPGTIVMASMAALGLAAVVIRKRRRA